MPIRPGPSARPDDLKPEPDAEISSVPPLLDVDALLGQRAIQPARRHDADADRPSASAAADRRGRLVDVGAFE